MKPKGTKGSGTFGDQRSVDALAARLGCGNDSNVRNAAKDRGVTGYMTGARKPLQVSSNAIGGSGVSMSKKQKPKKLPRFN